MTSQLVEHLTSGSTLKKQIAIVVLRRSIPPDMYQDVITTIVKSDTDPEVRKTALEQARTLRDIAPNVSQAIAQAAIDSSRSKEERQLASTTVRQLGLRSAAASGSFILASGLGFESVQLQSGIFTYYLLRGLSSEADIKKEGYIRFSQLSEYVRAKVREQTDGISPLGGLDPIILGKNVNYSKLVVLSIGNSAYGDSIIDRLRYADSDARDFGKFWQTREKSEVTTLVNATRAQMLDALSVSNQKADPNALQVFYYAGHAYTDPNSGKTFLIPSDTKMGNLEQTGVSTEEIRGIVRESPARVQLIFLDAGFTGSAFSSVK